MVEAELVISHLRSQLRNLQALLHYLEDREVVRDDDYAYSHGKLREVIGGLKELERFASQRGAMHRLRAEWVN